MKPGRYIGGEWNVSKNDFDKANLKFGLCFPDLYEVGMSNLGMRILYGILNNTSGIACERFFAPGIDLENNLRNSKSEIFSLESKKRLRDFDIIGFSLGNELAYTNILNILELGGVPFKSSQRDNQYPLIIAGGPAVLNPEPLHDFFDLFIIGEAEEAIVEITRLYAKIKEDYKNSKLSKEELLLALSCVEGVYVPSFYKVEYACDYKLKEFSPKIAGAAQKIKKRIVKDLENAYFPVNWLVPYIQIVHDRITLEAMRGCPNRCRFCQARQQYFPLRARSADKLFDLACQSYKNSGYEEIAVGGLSVSDYPEIEKLLKMLVGYFKEKAVGISLPSIKPKNLVGNASSLIASIKKTGLTFAPEAAREKLRKVLGKDFNSEEFFTGLRQSFASGYRRVKLYFMIGLPFEEELDLDGIADFSRSVSELSRETAKSAAEVNLSVNAMIPKPHTPFQWFKMQDLETIKYKQDYLRNKFIRNRKIKINFHNRYMSFLEGVFSRGDRRLGRVIIEAHKRGARFDAWQEHFKFEIWEEAFLASGIDPNYYLREKAREELLPWDFLDLGINKQELLNEFDKINK